MKKFLPKISIIFITLFVGWAIGTRVAEAQVISSLLGFKDPAVFVAEMLANIFNILQMIASWALILTGSILNYSINLTLQIKVFLEQTPAIYATWKALRDISGMFIIFALLWAAIRLTLGLGTKWGDLVRNIVMAGILINFSFFFAGLGIDASNIVSIQLYNAIAPANSLNAGNLNPGNIEQTWKDGGLSDIFMKSLKIPALYDTNGKITPAGQTAAAGGAWSAPIKIILIGVASIIIMLTAALSFAAAALAFIFRFVVLIFLLAFSPIWFASHIVPEIGDYAKKWTGAYKNMLVFMPVYLLLMYLALNILTTTPLLSAGDPTLVAAAAQAGATGAWYSSIIALAINAVIVIILLNFPLVAAISIASKGVSAFDRIDAGKWGLGGVLGGGRRFGGFAYQNTLARGASAVARSEGLKNFASKSAFGGAVLKGIRGTAAPYEEKLSKQVKARTEFAGSLGYNKEVARSRELELQDLQRQQSVLRSKGDKAGADALDSEIKAAKGKVEATKRERELQFAKTVNTPQIDTLWTKVARKDKIAAAKIEGTIVKKDLDEAQKSLEKVQNKITETQKNIDSTQNQIDTGQARKPDKARDKVNELKAKLPQLYRDEAATTAKVAKLQDRYSEFDNVS